MYSHNATIVLSIKTTLPEDGAVSAEICKRKCNH